MHSTNKIGLFSGYSDMEVPSKESNSSGNFPVADLMSELAAKYNDEESYPTQKSYTMPPATPMKKRPESRSRLPRERNSEEKTEDLFGQAILGQTILQTPPTPQKKRLGSKIPESPGKKRRVAEEKTATLPKSPYFQFYNDAISSGYVWINQQKVSVTLVTEGSFMAVFSVKAEKPLVEGVENSDLLIKMHHFKRIDHQDVVKYFESGIDNYNKAKAHGIAVSPIYNAETAVADKYILTLNIPEEVDLENQGHIKQISPLFQLSFQEEFPIDLSYSNLRVKEEKVFLVDFVEEPSLFLNRKTRRDFVITYLKSWCAAVVKMHMHSLNQSQEKKREIAERLLGEFTKGLIPKQIEPFWIQEALDQYILIVKI